MTKIYVFCTGEGVVGTWTLYTACALTEYGRWIAGAVSQTPELARSRCADMARRKAPEMLSGDTEVIEVETEAPCVERAVFQALTRMP